MGWFTRNRDEIELDALLTEARLDDRSAPRGEEWRRLTPEEQQAQIGDLRHADELKTERFRAYLDETPHDAESGSWLKRIFG